MKIQNSKKPADDIRSMLNTIRNFSTSTRGNLREQSEVPGQEMTQPSAQPDNGPEKEDMLVINNVEVEIHSEDNQDLTIKDNEKGIISQLIDDYRKCKNLLDNILLLLTTIGQLIPTAQPEIPLPLLALAGSLPGISATQMTMKTIQALQGSGMPTGPMPDGSPNLMLQFNSSSNKSVASNITEDGKVYTVGLAVQTGKFM